MLFDDQPWLNAKEVLAREMTRTTDERTLRGLLNCKEERGRCA
jgi:hypothetical protein